MPETRRHPPLAILLSLTLLVTQGAPAFGYENNQSGKTLGGGAHRKINQIAGALFMKEIVKGEQGALFRKYDFQPLAPAAKYKVITLNADVPEDFAASLFKPAGITVDARMNWRDATYEAALKKASFKFSGWVIEGGFTADEPERFMSLRHFYNPTDKGPAYLTDIPKGTGSWFMGDNPEIDAITWATGHPDNQYAWSSGEEYLRAAFSSGTLVEAQANYAAAWRSLGETMHLAADMTVPAHVRNDSHPGDWAAAGVYSDLRADAYEYLTNWGLTVDNAWSSGMPDPDLLKAVREAASPDALLKKVAGVVNRYFFSSDTIPYTNLFGSRTAFNVGWNNSIVYDAPRPEDMVYDEKTMNVIGVDSTGSPMLMAHESWLRKSGWGAFPGLVNFPTVESQAQRLVPIAVWSGERLMELFMPLVKVEVASVEEDDETGAPLITGTIGVRPALPGGGYAAVPSTELMQDTQQSVLLFVRLTKKDGTTEERVYLAPPTVVKGGEFELSLKDCTNADGLRDILFPAEGAVSTYTNIEYGVGLDMGGILVRSDYFGEAGIEGMWDVETTFDEVDIPPELMNTEGMGEEEAAAYVATMKQAYGGTFVGKTFNSKVEIVRNGADYTMKPQYDEKTKAIMAAGGYATDLATKLTGSKVRAELKTSFGALGGTSNVVDLELSADKKTMDGTFTTKVTTQAGQGTITVVYKGTWKGTKAD